MTTTSSSQNGESSADEKRRLRAVLTRFQRPSTARALWQIFNTIVPYVLLWVLMYHVIRIPCVAHASARTPRRTLLVRVFIFFHDCGHGSFFKVHCANAFLGFISGVLTFTPYYHWRWQHGIHHGTSGHLDKRGTGDVWTMTVQEYLDSSRWKRFSYRFVRNPFVLFVIAPLYRVLVRQRFPSPTAQPARASLRVVDEPRTARPSQRDELGVRYRYISAASDGGVDGGRRDGIWLFYVQHQFEDAYWERGDQWDYTAAALQGSSYYKLPSLLQWLSGNIGFHHIHHLSPRIPNYNLQRCHEADPLFQQVKPITLVASLKSLKFRFWDEPAKKLVGYRRMRQLRREQRDRKSR